MGYSFLQEYGSLLEVFTAVYVSMFIDDILKNIWTPNYKQKISQLIKDMNIPAVGYFEKKVEDNIDNNAKDIREHMKRKSVFLLLFCMSMLLLAGLESKSSILPEYGYIMVTILSLVVLLFIIFGRWTFIKYPRVIICSVVYCCLFIALYFFGLAEAITSLPWLSFVGYEFALCCLLTVLSIPILWQLFLIWVYSSLYKGYMQEKITKEAYVYGKAYIAYKIKDMAALPKDYEMAAKDFVSVRQTEGDTSLNSLNTILVERLECLCELPNVLKVFCSWLKYNIKGRHNHEAEYIKKNGFDYESMYTPEAKGDNPSPVSETLDDTESDDIEVGMGNSDGVNAEDQFETEKQNEKEETPTVDK